MDLIPDTKLIKRYIRWIERFDIRHARNWARLYKADPEAAMCEATFWGVLMDCGVNVEPNADLTGDKPASDFACWKDGRRFYVEVTCIHIATATVKTSLTHPSEQGFRDYSDLNDAIFAECRSKTPQCAGLDTPCLVAIGTFHFQASALCVGKVHLEMLLTGEQLLAWNVDTQRGEAIGDPYSVTHLRSAAFVRPGEHEIEHARNPVSGMLIGGFGCRPVNIYGVLHPQPNHPFDSSLLDRIEFCRLKEDYQTGMLSTEWTLRGETIVAHDFA